MGRGAREWGLCAPNGAWLWGPDLGVREESGGHRTERSELAALPSLGI